MLVKICGITNIEDADRAVLAGADMIGLNFWPRSSRYVTPLEALKIVEVIAGKGVLPVGIFVDAKLEDIVEITHRTNIEMIQLHGQESPEILPKLPRPVIKALKFNERGTDYEAYSKAKYILLDSPAPAQPGGTGQAWDWRKARDIGKETALILSGGLSPDNVAEAVEGARPHGVDVASGVEREPGLKDPDKLIEFIRAAKSARGDT